MDQVYAAEKGSLLSNPAPCTPGTSSYRSRCGDRGSGLISLFSQHRRISPRITLLNPCQSVSYPVKIHQKDSDKKSPGIVEIPGLFEYSRDRSALAEFLNLFEGRQALPKTPGKTEMVLRFPLSFP